MWTSLRSLIDAVFCLLFARSFVTEHEWQISGGSWHHRAKATVNGNDNHIFQESGRGRAPFFVKAQ